MEKLSQAFALFACMTLLLSACDADNEPAYNPIALPSYVYHTLDIPPGGTNGEEGASTLEYFLLEPASATDKPAASMPPGGYPLVIFLAGRSEAYSMERLLTHGADYFLKWQAAYPCYVVFPRCDEDCYWSYPRRPKPFTPTELLCPEQPTKMFDALMALVVKLKSDYAVNPERIVIAGYSMGAFGALDIAARAPLVFAGVHANAGGLNVGRAGALKSMHVWLEHCEEDDRIPCELTSALADELARLKGNDADATLSVHIYPGGSHISFHCFESPELMEWIYSVRRRRQI